MDSFEKHVNERPLNNAICPLCGEPNKCAMAADPNAAECWCEAVEFPAELLEKIPENAVRKTCVCQRCLSDYLESIKIIDQSS